MILLLSCCAFHVGAQFHDILNDRFTYMVNSVSDSAETENGNKKATPSVNPDRQLEKIRALWIDRYLSVFYPLDKMVVNSPFGIRKEPFTGKKRQHNGVDLQAKNERVYAMMAGEGGKGFYK